MIGRNSFEKQKMTHLTGKVILVTGAAGGIGSAISLAYAAVGATVMLGTTVTSKKHSNFVSLCLVMAM